MFYQEWVGVSGMVFYKTTPTGALKPKKDSKGNPVYRVKAKTEPLPC